MKGLFAEGTKLLLHYLILVQDTGGKKQKENIVLVKKQRLKQL